MADQAQDDAENKFCHENGALLIETRVEALEREEGEQKKRDNEYKERQLRINKRLMFFTGLLFVTSLISDGIFIYQSRVFKKAAEAAKKSAEIADATLTKMDEALRETKRSNELAQRAWVLIETIMIDEPVANKDLRLDVNERNYGKSPASQITTYAGPIILHIPPNQFRPKASYQRLIDSRMLAGPDKAFPSNFTFRLRDADIKEIQTGATLYIVGRITYVDPFFEISHTTRETIFCGYLKGKVIVTCRNGNYAR